MTNDEIVARGHVAARYLGDDDLMSFFTELQGDIKEALFNSTAAQLDERERLYSQHKGITDVLATMQLYASRAEAIIEARQVTIDPYDD